MTTTWTGKTVFTIREESLPDCPDSQQYAALCHETPARGYELALTLDADEIVELRTPAMPVGVGGGKERGGFHLNLRT